MRLTTSGFLIMLVVSFASPARATEVFVPTPHPPEILARQDLPEAIVALAISPDGANLAYAHPSEGRNGSSDVVWVGASTTTVTVAGTIRDLVFVADGSTLVGLQYRPAKKTQGDTFLFTWSGESKIRRIMRVPPSSNDLDRWPGGDAILLACRNEIRTILPIDFRSGPLFSFPGDNFAVTSLGQSSFVVVGQPGGLFLLDLSVPSGRQSMPFLAHQPLPGSVAELTDDPAGDEVVARLADGRLFRASFEPPGLQPAGNADRLAGMAKATSEPDFSFAPRAAAIQPDTDTVTVPPAPRKTPEPAAEMPPARTDPAPPTPAVPEDATPERPTSQPDSPAPAADAPARQLQGHIDGDAGLVETVVLLGPDNILREAARVRPDGQGDWGVDGLSPGRYRIQLDGGGTRVLVAEPRFLMVEVGTAPSRAPEIKVVRSF